MQQFTRGGSATLYCTFARLDGSAVNPVSPVVSIWQGATQIVAPFSLTLISTGFYTATWTIPGTQAPGTYTALFQGTIDSIVCQGSEDFEVTIVGGSVNPLIPNFYCSWDDVNACLMGLDVGDIPSNLQDRVENYYIPNLKAEIDNYCRQNFDLTTVTEFYNGSGTDKIVLYKRPVKELLNCVLRVIPSISWYTFRRWRNINVIDSQGIQVAVQGGPEPINNTVMPPYGPTDFTFDSTITNADLFVDCIDGYLVIPPRILYLEMQAIPFWNYTFLGGNKNVEVTYTYGYDVGNYPRDLKMAAAKLVACQVLLVKGISMGAGSNSISLDGVSRSFGNGTAYAAVIADFRQQAYAILDRFRRLSI